jgi:LacI family transcriptional regulator
MKKKAGIKQIAEAANVSIGTVDRALNGRPGISEATRQRVLQVAEQLLYQPNLAARVLSKGRTDLRIGVCVPREIHFYYDYLWEGILSEAERYAQLGAEFLNRPAPALGEGDDELLRGFLKDGVRGIIVTPGNPDAITPLINEAEEKNVRVVCVTTDAPLSKRSSIIGGQPKLAGTMAGELMAKFVTPGAQVAIITGQLYTEDQRKKTEGFSESFPKHCEEGRIAAVVEAHEDEDECFCKTFDLLAGNADLAGIYVNTANCLPVCRAIGARRLAGKVKLITSDLFPDLVPYFEKGTISASIHQRPHRQGQLAVRQLLDNLLQNMPFTNNFLNPGVVLQSNFRFFREIQRPFSPRLGWANTLGGFPENVEDLLAT